MNVTGISRALDLLGGGPTRPDATPGRHTAGQQGLQQRGIPPAFHYRGIDPIISKLKLKLKLKTQGIQGSVASPCSGDDASTSTTASSASPAS
ncbi:hypothetical protein [Actinoplanes sp. M2I2]|uniref:hypothetical protein n=1 Tax=Actinoplanes sp. M2I2 TaxID=1734444 RepID=UPI002021B460|nr:hypothetical protein [Actinoplanes sp. M2I2]